ncbi:hypothetical protein PGT21_015121 [Puccinia graminis f. sp. tritici]|uniref:CCHC-type domain-containing protein n=1 Tax=Puccinia graminis f. sp. tritici TaxID=56615 RepID=A0A5B0Q2G3_PUCGR|nr:hypothetical protein PGT21_015121 [Puccinia graminis f. sp. tritici]
MNTSRGSVATGVKRLPRSKCWWLQVSIVLKLAFDIKRAGLCYNSLHLRGQHYIQGPKQCYNCLAIGHLAHACKDKALCSQCGGNHNTETCEDIEDSSRSCQQCLAVDRKAKLPIDLTNPKYDHSPFNNACQPQPRPFVTKISIFEPPSSFPIT